MKKNPIIVNYEDLTMKDKFIDAVGGKMFQLSFLSAIGLMAVSAVTNSKAIDKASSYFVRKLTL